MSDSGDGSNAGAGRTAAEVSPDQAAGGAPAGLSRSTPLLLSIGVSTFGDGIRYAALPLVVALAGGSAPMLGVLLAAGTVPFLIMGVFGGAVVDRMDRAQVIRIADLVRFALALTFAALLLLDVGGTWVFAGALVLALGMGLGEAVVFPAVFALTPTVVASTHLQQFNARMVSVQSAGRDLLGPLAGAALVGLVTPAAFAVDAATFLISWALLSRLGRRPAPGHDGPRPALMADVRAGFGWMRQQSALLRLAAGGAMINLGNMGFLATEVIYLIDGLDASPWAYGFMMAFASVGGIGAAMVIDRLGDTRRARISIPLACGGISASMLLIGGAPHLLFALLGSTGAGASFAAYNVAVTTRRQQLTPDQWRGRSDSLYRLISWGALPIGSLLGGVLSGVIGPRTPALFTAITALAAAIWIATGTIRPTPFGDGTADENPVRSGAGEPV